MLNNSTLALIEELGKIPVSEIENLKAFMDELEKAGFDSYLDPSTDYLIVEKSKVMIKEIQEFFKTDTYSVDRGYTIYISHAPEFANQAVVENADGIKHLVDVSDKNYQDFD